MYLITLLVSASLLGSGDGRAICAHAEVLSCARPASLPDTVQRKSPIRRSRARDADQRYLRALAELIEAERSVCHAMMTEPAGHSAHGSSMDPADWDAAFDLQQREAVAMLKHDYNEVFSPVAQTPRAPTGHGAATGGSAEPAGMDGEMKSLVALMRQTVNLSNAAMPRLRHASTRGLARKVRDANAALILKVGSPMSH